LTDRPMNLFDYFRTTDPDFLPIAAHRRALAGEAVTYDMDWDGHTWHTHVEPLRGAEGAPAGVIGIALDITGRKRAEEALRAGEAKHRSLIENLAQAIFLKDRDLRYLAANAPFCESVDRTEAEVIGRDDFDLYPQHLAEKYRAADQLVLQEGRRLDLEEQ